MEPIGTVSAITQLLGVAAKFFRLYNEFREAGLVHASSQAAIGRLSQTIGFAIGGLEYVAKELEELKDKADKRGIEVPSWLKENPGNDAVPTLGSTCAAFRFGDWVVDSDSTLEKANEALRQRPVETNMQRWEFVVKGKKESSEKVKDKLRELQESLVFILLVVITGVPILRGRIEDDIKSKEFVLGVEEDSRLLNIRGEIPENLPSEEVLEKNNRYDEFVKNSGSVMDSFTQVNAGTEILSQDDFTSRPINDNKSVVDRSGGKTISRFKAPLNRALKRTANFGSSKYVDSHFTNESVPGNTTTPKAFTEGPGATVLSTKQDEKAKSPEERIPNDIAQEQPPQNNIVLLPSFERMFDKIIPLLAPQRAQIPTKLPTFSKASRVCTAYYGYTNSNWVPLFFQRLDNWLQLVLLPKDQNSEAVLIQPPIVEADEGSPLASYIDPSHDTLRLFYCRRDETGSRVLHEKILRLKQKNNTAWEYGSLHELHIRLAVDSNIILEGAWGTWVGALILFIVTPSFSLQMIRWKEGAWKTFTSIPLEKTCIILLQAKYDEREGSGIFRSSPKSILSVLASHQGKIVQYESEPWDEEKFHLTKFKKHPGYKGKSNWVSSAMDNVDITFCSVFKLCGFSYVDSKKNVFAILPVAADDESDSGSRPEWTKLGLGKLLHGFAAHYDDRHGTFVWVDDEGRLRRIKKGHFKFFRKYGYLGLQGGLVFSEKESGFVIALHQILESGDYSLSHPSRRQN